MKKQNKKKNRAVNTSVFIVKPKGQLRPQDNISIFDVVKWRHKFVLMSIWVYNFEELYS